jgi:ABC-type cobalamin transport system permease subunit
VLEIDYEGRDTPPREGRHAQFWVPFGFGACCSQFIMTAVHQALGSTHHDQGVAIVEYAVILFCALITAAIYLLWLRRKLRTLATRLLVGFAMGLSGAALQLPAFWFAEVLARNF